MGTKIDVWQIDNEKGLIPIETSLFEQGKSEPNDLEEWICKNPNLISEDFIIIGRQVKVISGGEIDILGIDTSGDLVVVELKRDKVPRLALAQAIEYASCVAEWDTDQVNSQCQKYLNQTLDDLITEVLPDLSSDDIVINNNQRIYLIGFSIEDSLERMISWLFDNFSVGINAITLQYAKTLSGDEILARSTIIAEELEKQKSSGKKFTIEMEDTPGNYDEKDLIPKVLNYLSQNKKTAQVIRTILLPLVLENDFVTRQMLKDNIVSNGYSDDKYSFTVVSSISSQMGMKKNDFLRQIIEYSYPNYSWEKENYKIREGYSDIITNILSELDSSNLTE